MRRTIATILVCVTVSSVLCAAPSPENGASETLQKQQETAVSLYKQGNYAEAAEMYRTMTERGCVSADIYYNLGNCCYKNGEIAESILNYERALLLAPNMDDARNNLALANTKKKDKVEEVGEFFLTEKKNALSNCMSSNGWAVMSIVCNLLMLCGIMSYFYFRKRLYRQIGFCGMITFFVLLVVSIEMSRTQKRRIEDREYAIVMSPSVTVSSTPDEHGEQLVVMHEGVKVKIKSRIGKWVEVKLPNGTIGWIQETDMEVI